MKREQTEYLIQDDTFIETKELLDKARSLGGEEKMSKEERKEILRRYKKC